MNAQKKFGGVPPAQKPGDRKATLPSTVAARRNIKNGSEKTSSTSKPDLKVTTVQKGGSEYRSPGGQQTLSRTKTGGAVTLKPAPSKNVPRTNQLRVTAATSKGTNQKGSPKSTGVVSRKEPSSLAPAQQKSTRQPQSLSKGVLTPTRKTPTRGVPAVRKSLTRGVPGTRRSLTRLATPSVSSSKKLSPKIEKKGELEEAQSLITNLKLKVEELEEKLRLQSKGESDSATNLPDLEAKLQEAMKRIGDIQLDNETLLRQMETLKVEHQRELDATVQDCATVIKCGVSFWDESKAECEELRRKNSELESKLESLLLESGVSKREQKLNELRKTSGGVSIRNALLKWCQNCVKDVDLEITNFSSSWADGYALCAVLHSLDKGMIDLSKVDKATPQQRFEVAVAASKKMGVKAELDIQSILSSGNPPWELVMSYVSEIYVAASK